jgi:hypothetical protein
MEGYNATTLYFLSKFELLDNINIKKEFLLFILLTILLNDELYKFNSHKFTHLLNYFRCQLSKALF